MMSMDEGKHRSNMVFSCGPGREGRQVIPEKFYRVDQYDITYFKLTAPLFVRLKDINNVYRLTQVNGPVVFVASGDSFWGGEKAKNYRSKVIDNPTYRSLLGSAKSSQKVTRDYHHQFIEDVTFQGYEEIDGRQVMVLRMVFGS